MSNTNFYDENSRKCIRAIFGKKKPSIKFSERPDFVFQRHAQNNNLVVVGIEHFEIAHNSRENQNGKIIASDNVVRKEVNRIFNKYYNPDGVEITDSVVSDLQSLTKKDFDMIKNSKYKDFLSAFQYSYKKHKEKVEEYYKKLSKIADKKYNKEICFLFDIRYHFMDYCRFDGKNFHVEHGITPLIFSEMIDIIEKDNDSRISYIIFVISDDIDDSRYGVYAFRNKDIRLQFKKNNIAIYEFLITEFQKDIDISMGLSEKEINALLNIETQNEEYIKNYQQNVKKAINCIMCKKPFITNKSFLNHYNQYGLRGLKEFMKFC